jgi:hypothetical protein
MDTGRLQSRYQFSPSPPFKAKWEIENHIERRDSLHASLPDNMLVMKSTFRDRLDRVLGAKDLVSDFRLKEAPPSEPSDLAIKLLIDSLLESGAAENVLVIDESESLRVVASNPSLPSIKRRVASLIADMATYLTTKNYNKFRVIRIGASGQSRNPWLTHRGTNSGNKIRHGNTPKSEKTAYLLRSMLNRLSSSGHLIVISDFRSHMWRRTLNALITAGPQLTLVHLVDVIDCDFVLSSDDQLELATQHDPSPWSTPTIDSTIPPSDVHAYLTAFSDLNAINLLGIVVQESTLEEIMSAFERAIIHV